MKTKTGGRNARPQPPVPQDPWLRLVDYLLALHAPPSPAKTARVLAIEKSARGGRA